MHRYRFRNAKYGNDPGVVFYTHISDQFGPYHMKIIAASAKEAPHVLDGLLYHESGLKIDEHSTDTGGFSDQIFGICNLLGYRFMPRIRDLKDKKLYSFEVASSYPALEPLIARQFKIDLIHSDWDDVLRLASSIKMGIVTASHILKKMAAYPRQNRLAQALREVGRIDRTLFTLQWLQDNTMRHVVQNRQNKVEHKNDLSKAIFFNRHGEIRDRTFENQMHRASGLNLLTAAVILWNTKYLRFAVNRLRADGADIPEHLLAHVWPTSWGHINLTGHYSWQTPDYEAPTSVIPINRPRAKAA